MDRAYPKLPCRRRGKRHHHGGDVCGLVVLGVDGTFCTIPTVRILQGGSFCSCRNPYSQFNFIDPFLAFVRKEGIHTGAIARPDHPCMTVCGHSNNLRALIRCKRMALSAAKAGHGSTLGGLRMQATISLKGTMTSILG